MVFNQLDQQSQNTLLTPYKINEENLRTQIRNTKLKTKSCEKKKLTLHLFFYQ